MNYCKKVGCSETVGPIYCAKHSPGNKCAVKGCVRSTVNGRTFCVYHPNASPSVTCDNIPAIKENMNLLHLTEKHTNLKRLESELQAAVKSCVSIRWFMLANGLEMEVKSVSSEILKTREAIDNEVKCQNAQAPILTATFPMGAPVSITLTVPCGEQNTAYHYNLTGKTTP